MVSWAELREDIRANHGQVKGQVIVASYRIAHAARQPLDRRPRLVAVPVGLVYRFVVEWVLGVEIPWGTRIGRRLRVHHGVGIVVNDDAVLGDDVVLRQNVTIGNKGGGLPSPVIGDGVRIGASAVILGDITIGRGASIGAGAVVVKDVPDGAVAAGNPARILPSR